MWILKTFIIRTLIVFGFIYVMLASIIISITHLYQSDFSDKVALEYGYKEHDIEERKSEKMDVYVDDNYQLLPSFDITREALQTRIDINFKFIDENMNHQVLLVVTKDGVNYPNNPNEIKIEPSFYYHMIITAQIETGLKTYAYYLQRDEETFYYLGSLDITKKKVLMHIFKISNSKLIVVLQLFTLRLKHLIQ